MSPSPIMAPVISSYTVYTRQSETHRISHSNVLGVLEVCLELLSSLKDQFGFFR